MRTVIPTYISFDKMGQVSPMYDTLAFFPLIFMIFSTFGTYKVTLHIMPEFTPNPIMLDRHADKGAEPWEIYAWCVRDAISKKSGLPKQANNNFKDKTAYCEFMTCEKDYMEVYGRIFMISGTYDSKDFSSVSR